MVMKKLLVAWLVTGQHLGEEGREGSDTWPPLMGILVSGLPSWDQAKQRIFLKHQLLPKILEEKIHVSFLYYNQMAILWGSVCTWHT